MKSVATIFIEGIFNGNWQNYVVEAKQRISAASASVLVCNICTDYFVIDANKAVLNAFLDAVRAQGVTTGLIFNPAYQVQDLSGIRADTVEFVNFHLWRAYNEIINKKQCAVNPKWNRNAKDFLFLTGKPDRVHRLRLLWKLSQQGLLNNCCWSFWYNKHNIDELARLVPEIDSDELPHLLDSWVRNPDSIDMQQRGTSFHYCGLPYDVTLFSNSKFRLISESIFGNRFPAAPENYWLGEKTYITLFNRVPWIIAGQPGSLQWLTRQGYATFESQLSCHYDTVLDQEQRLDQVVANTQFWMANMPDPDLVEQQVEHNFYHALDQAKQNETMLRNLIRCLDLNAQPDQIVPTVDK